MDNDIQNSANNPNINQYLQNIKVNYSPTQSANSLFNPSINDQMINIPSTSTDPSKTKLQPTLTFSINKYPNTNESNSISLNCNNNNPLLKNIQLIDDENVKNNF